MAGRLILQSSNVAWIAEGKKERPEKVYEAIIEDKGKNFIFMRLSKACVDELGLVCDQDFVAQVHTHTHTHTHTCPHTLRLVLIRFVFQYTNLIRS